MRQRAWTELTEDPRFPYMVGRLIGAAEGTAALLGGGKVDTEQQQQLSERLYATTEWFLEQHLTKPAARSPER